MQPYIFRSLHNRALYKNQISTSNAIQDFMKDLIKDLKINCDEYDMLKIYDRCKSLVANCGDRWEKWHLLIPTKTGLQRSKTFDKALVSRRTIWRHFQSQNARNLDKTIKSPILLGDIVHGQKRVRKISFVLIFNCLAITKTNRITG